MILFLAKLLISRNPAMTLPYAKRLVKAGLIAIAALLAMLAFTLWLNGREKAAEVRGATIQREGDLRETINRTEQGNAARSEVREAYERNGGRSRAVYDQCVRTARTPAHCERFLPEQPADQR